MPAARFSRVRLSRERRSFCGLAGLRGAGRSPGGGGSYLHDHSGSTGPTKIEAPDCSKPDSDSVTVYWVTCVAEENTFPAGLKHPRGLAVLSHVKVTEMEAVGKSA